MKTIVLLFSILLLSLNGIEASSLDDRASDDSSDHLSPSKARYIGIGNEDAADITFGPAFRKYYEWCQENKKSCNIDRMKKRLKKVFKRKLDLEDLKNEFHSDCVSFYKAPPSDIRQLMFEELLAEVKREAQEAAAAAQPPHRNSYSSTSEEGEASSGDSHHPTPEKQPSPKGDKQA